MTVRAERAIRVKVKMLKPSVQGEVRVRNTRVGGGRKCTLRPGRTGTWAWLCELPKTGWVGGWLWAPVKPGRQGASNKDPSRLY